MSGQDCGGTCTDLEADSRLWVLGRRVDPGCGERFERWAGQALGGGPASLGSLELAEDGTGFLGEFGPFGGLGPSASGFEPAVGDGYLAAGPFGLRELRI